MPPRLRIPNATNRSYICSHCLRGLPKTAKPFLRSPFSSTATHSSSASSSSESPASHPNPSPPPPPSGYTHLPTRSLISVTGPDAPKFLQGLITNNLRPGSTQGFYAAFLTAQGRVLYDVFIYPLLSNPTQGEREGGGEPGYLVEVDATQAGELERHLKRHKLRSKVKVRRCEEGEWGVWQVWREGDRWTQHSHEFEGSEGVGAGRGGKESVLGLVDCRAPGMGRRVLLPDGKELKDVEGFEGLERAGLESYTIRRMVRGVPEGQGEILRESALPMESDVDYMGGIDFKKGCYVGQELTIRTKHTGVVRKRILPVVLYHGDQLPEKLEYDPSQGSLLRSAQLESGTDIKNAEGKGRSAGKFLSGIGNIGLALCRLEMMTNLNLSGEGEATVDREIPRFKVNLAASREGEDSSIGIKAFVPEWHAARAGPKKGPARRID